MNYFYVCHLSWYLRPALLRPHLFHIKSNSVPIFWVKITWRSLWIYLLSFSCSTQFCSKLFLSVLIAFLQDEQSSARFSQSFYIMLAVRSWCNLFASISAWALVFFLLVNSPHRHCLGILSFFILITSHNQCWSTKY